MTKSAKDLTDTQKEKFTTYFYDNFDCDDQDSPSPWGCPWMQGSKVKLEGFTIEEMAQNFWNDYRDEIFDLSKTIEA